MSRKMLILDFDGVVTDTEPLNYAAWTKMFAEELNLTHAGDHAVLVGLTLDEIFGLWMPELPDRETKERLLAIKNDHYFELARATLKPIDGSIALVRRAIAQGAYTAIASRSRRVRLLRTLDIIGFPAIFDIVMGDEDVVSRVTERKNHALAAERYGIAPTDCIVIEDSAAGVRDAVDCGIGRVIGFTTTLSADTLWQAGAHQVVNHLDDVVLW